MTEEQHDMNQNQLVEQVFELTEAIDQAARIADWQLATRLADQRSPLLMSIGPQQEPAALALIRRIQAMDVTTMSEAKVAQSELDMEFRAAMERSKAASQYHRVALLR